MQYYIILQAKGLPDYKKVEGKLFGAQSLCAFCDQCILWFIDYRVILIYLQYHLHKMIFVEYAYRLVMLLRFYVFMNKARRSETV